MASQSNLSNTNSSGDGVKKPREPPLSKREDNLLISLRQEHDPNNLLSDTQAKTSSVVTRRKQIQNAILHDFNEATGKKLENKQLKRIFTRIGNKENKEGDRERKEKMLKQFERSSLETGGGSPLQEPSDFDPDSNFQLEDSQLASSSVALNEKDSGKAPFAKNRQPLQAIIEKPKVGLLTKAVLMAARGTAKEVQPEPSDEIKTQERNTFGVGQKWPSRQRKRTIDDVRGKEFEAMTTKIMNQENREAEKHDCAKVMLEWQFQDQQKAAEQRDWKFEDDKKAAEQRDKKFEKELQLLEAQIEVSKAQKRSIEQSMLTK